MRTFKENNYFLSIILASIFVVFFTPPIMAYDFESGVFGYDIVSVKNKTARPTTLLKAVDTLTIPASVDYNGITFKVEHVRKIEGTYVSTPKSVVIEEGIKSLSYTFCGFTNLSSISFPTSLDSIDGGAFANTALEEIDIPATVKHITGDGDYGYYLFNSCNKLKTVHFLGEIIIDAPFLVLVPYYNK